MTALLSYALGNKKSNELPLFRQQWNTFQPGDIFLADKGFCSYFDIAMLQKQGVDSLISVARRKPVKAAHSREKFGPNDLLITWKRPVHSANLSYSKEAWKELPEELVFRQIKISVNHPGFRKKSFYVVTTLLDPQAYPAEEIADLYFRRWDVELFFAT